MARPKSPELTERELEVMHVFWDAGESSLTAAEVRDKLDAAGRRLAYTTVATLARILIEKEFLRQTNDQRPFAYAPVRSFEDVSRRMVGNLVDRVFQGSREQLLLRLVEAKRLTAKEREVLKSILQEKKS
jgi:predicted transcriptional regulator